MNTLPLFPVDRWIKLRDVEIALREYFLDGSCPSRSTIIGWIEEGTLEGKQIGTGRNYYVRESSFAKFKASLGNDSFALAA